MRHELFYTSAPRGLFPGAAGFCTVKVTQGIPLQLRELLESISSYRHLYPPNDPRAGSNPIAFSHVMASISGTRWHILSRVQAAGLDHTKRSNFFAHHIAIADSDLPSADSTQILSQPGIMQEKWDGRVEELSQCRQIAGGPEPIRRCLSWQAVTGDAGWAGVIADACISRKRSHIVYDAGRPVLPLVAEVMGLLPTDARWDATFTTYFSSLPQSVDCKLRCVIAGTLEAKTASSGGASVVDITKKTGTPPATVTVESARTGTFAQKNKSVSASGKARSKASRKSLPPLGIQAPQGSPSLASSAERAMPLVASNDYAEQPSPILSPRGKAWWLLVGVFAGVLTICLVLVPIVLLLNSQKNKANRENTELLAKNQSQQKDLAYYKSESAERISELRKAAAAKESNEEKMKGVHADFIDRGYEVEELTKDKEDLQKDGIRKDQELQAAKSAFQTERAAFQTEIATLKRQYATLERQYKDLNTQKLGLERENRSLRGERPQTANLPTVSPGSPPKPIDKSRLPGRRAGEDSVVDTTTIESLEEFPGYPRPTNLVIKGNPSITLKKVNDRNWQVRRSERGIARLSVKTDPIGITFVWDESASRLGEQFDVVRADLSKCSIEVQWQSKPPRTITLTKP